MAERHFFVAPYRGPDARPARRGQCVRCGRPVRDPIHLPPGDGAERDRELDRQAQRRGGRS